MKNYFLLILAFCASFQVVGQIDFELDEKYIDVYIDNPIQIDFDAITAYPKTAKEYIALQNFLKEYGIPHEYKSEAKASAQVNATTSAVAQQQVLVPILSALPAIAELIGSFGDKRDVSIKSYDDLRKAMEKANRSYEKNKITIEQKMLLEELAKRFVSKQ